MPTLRQARVAEMIKRDLSEILQREMRDPRLALVSVTNVEVSRDFTFAKVFVSVLGDAQEKAEAVKALQGASGFLRGQLGRMLELRTVPQLAFRYDTGIERGARMFELLREEEKTLADNVPGDETAAAEPRALPDDEALEDDELEDLDADGVDIDEAIEEPEEDRGPSAERRREGEAAS
jgi:ribosome-binding factor A